MSSFIHELYRIGSRGTAYVSTYEYTVGLVNPIALAIAATFTPSPAIRLIIPTCSSVTFNRRPLTDPPQRLPLALATACPASTRSARLR